MCTAKHPSLCHGCEQCTAHCYDKSKGHPHAEFMMQYAQDATENRSPELLWEYRTSSGQDWKQCIDCPTWQPAYQYRRKPRTININGYEVPEPVSKPLSYGQVYWCPDYQAKGLVNNWSWYDTVADERLLQRGFIHLTREAAELHATALLSFTSKE